MDSGAVTAAAGDTVTRRRLLALAEAGWTPIVPAVVLSEALHGDGRRDARTNRLLGALGDEAVVPCDETLGRSAAALRRHALRTASPSGVDAIVAAHAVASSPAAVVMTGDPGDLGALVARHLNVRVLQV